MVGVNAATFLRRITPGILPSALRASLRLFKIAPGDFVASNSKYRALVTPVHARFRYDQAGKQW